MTKMQEDEEKLPKFAVSATLNRRDKLQTDERLVYYVGQKLLSNTYHGFVSDLYFVLDEKIKRNVLDESAKIFLGKKLTAREFDQFCWRIAGNYQTLRAGTPARPWVLQRADEWVPAQILATTRSAKYSRIGADVLFQVLAGSPCPSQLTWFWSDKALRVVARKIGFPPNFDNTIERYKMYPYRDHRELVDMQLALKLTPDPRKRRNVQIAEVSTTSGMALNNRALMRNRARLDGSWDCPFEYPLNQPCHLCPVGLDQCAVAVHAATYYQEFCSGCEGVSVFDPLSDSNHCVNCCDREAAASAYTAAGDQ